MIHLELYFDFYWQIVTLLNICIQVAETRNTLECLYTFERISLGEILRLDLFTSIDFNQYYIYGYNTSIGLDPKIVI